jgi:transposase-like protein
MPRPRISDAIIQQILAMRDAGVTIRTTANVCGVSTATVKNYSRRAREVKSAKM